MLSCPVAVVGGGLAGLAASMATQAPVFEASDAFGGVAASDARDGYIFDRGIHILQTRNPRIIKLLDELGVRLNRHQRRAYIHSHGVFTPYPFQVNTAGMPLGLRARCVRDYLCRERRRDARTYEEWMYANIGRGFAETFLIPYSEKFWTVHPREMTHDWTGSRVPPTSALHVLRGAIFARQTPVGSNAEFRYPVAGGYGAITRALLQRTGPLLGGHRACRIEARKRLVHFANGERVQYERLVATLPLPDLVRMCDEAPADVLDAVSCLRTNSIRVVNLGIARPAVSDWHWVHFPDPSIRFFRISFPHNFADDIAPPGHSAISVECSYRRDDPPDDAQLTRRVVDDLKRVGLLRADDRIVHTSTHDIPYAYCIYDFERKPAARKARAWLLSRDIIAAGRYGTWSYFWSDEAMMSGLQAGEKALRPASHPEHEEAALAAE